jgi:hypothetical protein
MPTPNGGIAFLAVNRKQTTGIPRISYWYTYTIPLPYPKLLGPPVAQILTLVFPVEKILSYELDNSDHIFIE